MILIAGLGNPGEKYVETRHNVGFMAIDRLSEEFKVKFEFSKRFKAEYAKVKSDLDEIILIKPQTYMNNSGEAVKAITKFYEVSCPDVWVIHDDIDIDLGKIRIRKGGSSAGQKGVQSVINNLGTEEFVRFRVGIKSERVVKIPTEEYVLRKFRKEEREIIDEEIEKITEIINNALKNGIEEVTI